MANLGANGYLGHLVDEFWQLCLEHAVGVQFADTLRDLPDGEDAGAVKGIQTDDLDEHLPKDPVLRKELEKPFDHLLICRGSLVAVKLGDVLGHEFRSGFAEVPMSHESRFVHARSRSTLSMSRSMGKGLRM